MVLLDYQLKVFFVILSYYYDY